MKLKEAIELHNEDEVIVKKTGCAMYVIETEAEYENGKIKRINIMLEDGNWYGHKEIK